MTELTVAAIDLGAESGRVTRAAFDGRRIDLSIVNRFSNTPLDDNGRPRWDIASLWESALSGLQNLGAQTTVSSVGVDSWGVDFGLLKDGALLEAPLTYRDAGREAGFAYAMNRWGAHRFYDATGSQLHEINSVYGLIDEARRRPDLLTSADQLLMIPDIFHHRLSGSRVTEYTVATTTGMFDLDRGRWASELVSELGIPTSLLPEVVPPGTDLGRLRIDDAESGLSLTRVIAPAAHDTASAVIAIPRPKSTTMFISSGTWSLAGILVDHPVVNETARLANLTNEGGYAGKTRFLRDIVGLWVLQECRRQWKRNGLDLDYETLGSLTAAEPALTSYVDIEAVDFLRPGDMPARIRSVCAAMGMTVPESPGQIARVVVDSLALAYRRVARDIEFATGISATEVAVVGGGTANDVLQQSTASATGLPVICWAREATALGNSAVQLAALGELHGPDEIWDVVAASTTPRTFTPVDTARWDDAAARLDELRVRPAEHAPTS